MTSKLLAANPKRNEAKQPDFQSFHPYECDIMPPQFPSVHRGMTANPARAKRYRPGKPIAEEPSSDEDEEVEEEEEAEARARAEEEERKKRQQQQARPPPPKATSYPTQAAGRLAKGVQEVKIEDEDSDEDSDEEGFVTEEEEEEQKPAPAAKPTPVQRVPAAAEVKREDEEEEEEESEEEEEEEEDEEEESEEESSEEESPKRVLLRPTFIKKDKRKDTNGEIVARTSGSAEAEDEAEAQRRKEKADMLLRDQLEKEALARAATKKAWDEDEAAEEAALDDRDGLDPEAEYQAWRLRELKRIKRARDAIEAAEREREEIERRRNLTAEEREREDREFLAKQREEREANRGPSKYLQRYFHKGAFFRDELEKEGLDKRDLMGSRYADETNREVLPEYMQLRDMTKLGRKGRTRYKDLRTEDTGRWGQGLDYRPRKPRPDKPIGINDERFMPDYDPRQRSPSRRTRSRSRDRYRSRSRSRSHSPRRRYRDDDYDRDDDRRYTRKRSHSPHDDRDKRRRLRSISPTR